ncbi:hypothetical protein [Metabacillus sp. RGM 3146]|uniref:hypothetical protein n=1 Tax=Metabacillus sp. RGM 3146 TaxID=3401092 RepID=UPI003B9B5DD7
MAISEQLVEEAIECFAAIEGIEMNSDELVDDVILVAYVFEEELAFKSAISQIINSLKLITRNRNIGNI